MASVPPICSLYKPIGVGQGTRIYVSVPADHLLHSPAGVSALTFDPVCTTLLSFRLVNCVAMLSFT